MRTGIGPHPAKVLADLGIEPSLGAAHSFASGSRTNQLRCKCHQEE